MTPFPGESFGVYDAWSSDPAVGWDLSKSITNRGGIGGFPTHVGIAAGDEWRCWMSESDGYSLESTYADPLELAWCVEVLGGTGTLVLSDYEDAGWVEDTGLTLPNALGTLTVTGAGTYTMPTASFTTAQVAAGSGAMELRIECTSGAVDVQQVKLRVFPVGGPLGGWGDLLPGWDETAYVQSRAFTPTVGDAAASASGADAAAADAALNYLLPISPPPTDLQTQSYPPGSSQVLQGEVKTHFVDLAEVSASIGWTVIAVGVFSCDFTYSNPIDPSAGVSYVVPPYEANSDTYSHAQTEGSHSFAAPASARQLLLRTSGNAPSPMTESAGLTIASYYGPQPALGDPVTLSTGGLVLGTDEVNAEVYGGYTVPAFTDLEQALYLVFGFSANGGKPSMADWNPTGIEDIFVRYEGYFEFGGIPGTISHPPYRVWNPAAAPEPSVVRWWPRNDGLLATSPARIGQQSSYQSGRGGGYQ